MTSAEAALKKAAFESERALTAYNMAIFEYRDACCRFDWDIVESLRLKTLSSLEAFLDNMVAAQRLLEAQRGRS